MTAVDIKPWLYVDGSKLWLDRKRNRITQLPGKEIPQGICVQVGDLRHGPSPYALRDYLEASETQALLERYDSAALAQVANGIKDLPLTTWPEQPGTAYWDELLSEVKQVKGLEGLSGLVLKRYHHYNFEKVKRSYADVWKLIWRMYRGREGQEILWTAFGPVDITISEGVPKRATLPFVQTDWGDAVQVAVEHHWWARKVATKKLGPSILSVEVSW